MSIYSAPFTAVVDKSGLARIEKIYDIPDSITAPVKKGEVIGEISYMLDGEEIGKSEVYASVDVEQIGFVDLLGRILKRIICG